MYVFQHASLIQAKRSKVYCWGWYGGVFEKMQPAARRHCKLQASGIYAGQPKAQTTNYLPPSNRHRLGYRINQLERKQSILNRWV